MAIIVVCTRPFEEKKKDREKTHVSVQRDTRVSTYTGAMLSGHPIIASEFHFLSIFCLSSPIQSAKLQNANFLVAAANENTVNEMTSNLCATRTCLTRSWRHFADSRHFEFHSEPLRCVCAVSHQSYWISKKKHSAIVSTSSLRWCVSVCARWWKNSHKRTHTTKKKINLHCIRIRNVIT